MVIDGGTGFNGSALSQARDEIQKRLATPKPVVTLSIVSLSPTQIRVTVRSKNPALKNATVEGVLTEDASSVHVLRGENSGETMSGASSVRRHVTAPALVNGMSTFVAVRDPMWSPTHLSIAIWLTNGQPIILAAQQAHWPSTIGFPPPPSDPF